MDSRDRVGNVRQVGWALIIIAIVLNSIEQFQRHSAFAIAGIICAVLVLALCYFSEQLALYNESRGAYASFSLITLAMFMNRISIVFCVASYCFWFISL